MKSLPLVVPVNIHPSVSWLELPGWIRTPSKFGTFNNSGNNFLNLFDLLIITLYLPFGIAVLSLIFLDRTGSSTVKHNTSSLYHSVPDVLVPFVYSLTKVILSVSLTKL